MTRRVTAIAALLLATSLVAEAQRSTIPSRVGFLGAESLSTNQHFLDAFRLGLQEHGYVEGQNI